nr:hypothetical protein [Tanacetum cinerariifolium]
MPRDCLRIIESKLKVCNSRNKLVVSRVSTYTSSTNLTQFPEVVSLTDAVKNLLCQNKTPTPASVKVIEDSCVTCGGPYPYYNCSGSLLNNTIANPRGDLKAITTRSGVSYDGPPIPPVVEREPEATKDKVQTTCPETVLLKKLPEKHTDPGRFLLPCDFQALESCMALADLVASHSSSSLNLFQQHYPIALTCTSSSSGSLLNNTIANPRGDLKAITTRSGVSYDGPPIPPVVEREPEATKDKVQTTCPETDFVVVDYDVDPRVPLILGRPFLRMACSLVDVQREELM